mmetsp:Transcript_10451/g.30339  ORF Transcript_10451/g.30339 Transcript_10451/m.30339 type:complete len:328 (+) Transcript_10451:3-986(+)
MAEAQRAAGPQPSRGESRGGAPAGAFPAASPGAAENFATIIREAKVHEWPREEQVAIAQTANESATKLMNPAQIAVVQELKPEERKQLTDWAVEQKILPREQASVVEDVVRPGGFLDQFARLQQAVQLSPYYAVACVVEFGFSLLLSFFSCAQPLSGWLQFDSSLGLLCCLAGFVVYRQLGAAARVFMSDPHACMERWHLAPGVDQDWTAGLEAAVPGVGLESYRIAGAAGVAILVLLIVGAIWGVLGLLELIGSIFMGCLFSLIFLVAGVYIAFRLASIAAAAYVAQQARGVYEKLNVGAAPVGSSQLPMRDDAMPLVDIAGRNSP